MLTSGIDPDPLIGRVKFSTSLRGGRLQPEVSDPCTQLSQSQRVELCDPAAQRERRPCGASIRPVERDRDQVLVGKPHHDARATGVAQVPHDGESSTHERVDGVGDDDQFRRWSDLRWGLVK